MGENTITKVEALTVLQQEHLDQYATAIELDFVPRNADGVPTAEAGNLGTESLPWNEGHLKSLYVDGLQITPPSDNASAYNAIISGAKSALSEQSKFLLASGSTNKVTILGASTQLNLTINGAAVAYSDDVDIVSLTQAPSTNNTCLINDSRLSGQNDTKYIQRIAIDTVGSNITALNGKMAAFKVSTEVFLALVDTTNGYLIVQQRGGFFDSSNAAISRVTLSDNATITLLSACWIFADGSGTQGNFTSGLVSYAATAPTSPATNDYWYDTDNNQWMRYSGSAWQGTEDNVDRVLIGVAVCDSSNCIAARSADFTADYAATNTLALIKKTNAQMTASRVGGEISVAGRTLSFGAPLVWDMTLHLASGVTEANSTRYFFYVKNNGDVVISDVAPNYYPERRGGYHPFETWRFVGSALNDGSGNLGAPNNYIAGELVQISSTGAVFNPHGLNYSAVVVGGGGGGAASGSSGTASTLLWSTGSAGGGAGSGAGTPGAGGTASGGINAQSGTTGGLISVAHPSGGSPSLGVALNGFIGYSTADNDDADGDCAGRGGGGHPSAAGGGGGAGSFYDFIVNKMHGFAFIGTGGAKGSGSGGAGADGAAFIKYF